MRVDRGANVGEFNHVLFGFDSNIKFIFYVNLGLQR